MELYSNLKEGEKGAWLSIWTYLALSAVKLIIGYIGSSEALKADGLNNTTDIIASIAILVGLRIAQKPPDADHQYGHMRAETVASLVAAFIMAFVGFQILLSAGKSIINPVKASPSMLTAVVAILSALVMFLVYRYNLNLSKRIKSEAVRAAAYDNRSDALVSVGTAVGILGAVIGFPIIDSITAFIIGLLVIYTAWKIFYPSVHTLTDGFDEDDVESLSEIVLRVEGVVKLKEFKGRMHGNLMFIDLTITVNPILNVIQSHRITEEIERKIGAKKPHSVILVHIEPDLTN
ncbi:cation transporter [Sporosarcina sp. Marseille-Q4063]|uniref:cation diffusion facilitator family transporter n=1 Tax=Sporosarcina sp. Marseille-Q4063 TaxID=2810514 RepID=UPI001BAFE7C9|nr:cation diffusion facilitator family transporter [Sporosarcina sp. Marseille-Q4063]QUW23465.1 cation transporter [Sporosarcina sp. Marseille-Q4063]